MRYPNHFKYLENLRRKLLGAGTVGIGQSELNQATRTKVFAGEAMAEALREWELRGWVQSFRVTGLSRHPGTMWRATTALRDEWLDKMKFENELPTVVAEGSSPSE